MFHAVRARLLVLALVVVAALAVHVENARADFITITANPLFRVVPEDQPGASTLR